MVSSRSLITVFATFIAVATSQKCYAVDGTTLDSTYTPCNPSAQHSQCCASTDICMSNGLCVGTTNESIGMIFSRGCTDPTGKDASCSQTCPGLSDDFNGLKPVKAWQLQTCDYGTYCCRGTDDTKSCCNNVQAPQVTTTFSATLQLQSSTSIPTPDSVDVVATAGLTGIPNATTMPLPNVCTKEKRQTAIVGGTLAAIFSMIIAGLAATIFWMYKREKRQRRIKEHYEEQFSQTNAYRKALASSAGSCRGSVMLEELKLKSNGPE